MAKVKISVALYAGQSSNPFGDIAFSYNVNGEGQQQEFTGTGEQRQKIDFPEVEISDAKWTGILAELRSTNKNAQLANCSHAAKVRWVLTQLYGSLATANWVDIPQDHTETALTPVTVFKNACDMALLVNALGLKARQKAEKDARKHKLPIAALLAAGPEVRAGEAKAGAAPAAESKAAALAEQQSVEAIVQIVTHEQSTANIAQYVKAKRAANVWRRLLLKPLAVLASLFLVGLIIYLTGGLGLATLPWLVEALGSSLSLLEAAVGSLLLGSAALGVMFLHQTTTARKAFIAVSIVLAAVGAGLAIALTGGTILLAIAAGVAAGATMGYFTGFLAWCKKRLWNTPTFSPEAAPYLFEEEAPTSEAKRDPAAPAPEAKAVAAAAKPGASFLIDDEDKREAKEPTVKVPDPTFPPTMVTILGLGFKIPVESKAAAGSAPAAVAASAAAPEAKAVTLPALPLTKRRLIALDLSVDPSKFDLDDGGVPQYLLPWNKVLPKIILADHQRGIQTEFVVITTLDPTSPEAHHLQADKLGIPSERLKIIQTIQTDAPSTVGILQAEVDMRNRQPNQLPLQANGVYAIGRGSTQFYGQRFHEKGYFYLEIPEGVQRALRYADGRHIWHEWLLDRVLPILEVALPTTVLTQDFEMKSARSLDAYRHAYSQYSEGYDRYKQLLTGYETRFREFKVNPRADEQQAGEQTSRRQVRAPDRWRAASPADEVNNLRKQREKLASKAKIDARDASEDRVLQHLMVEYNRLQQEVEGAQRQIDAAKATLGKKIHTPRELGQMVMGTSADAVMRTPQVQAWPQLEKQAQAIAHAYRADEKALSDELARCTQRARTLRTLQAQYHQALTDYDGVLTDYTSHFASMAQVLDSKIGLLKARIAQLMDDPMPLVKDALRFAKVQVLQDMVGDCQALKAAIRAIQVKGSPEFDVLHQVQPKGGAAESKEHVVSPGAAAAPPKNRSIEDETRYIQEQMQKAHAALTAKHSALVTQFEQATAVSADVAAVLGLRRASDSHEAYLEHSGFWTRSLTTAHQVAAKGVEFNVAQAPSLRQGFVAG